MQSRNTILFSFLFLSMALRVTWMEDIKNVAMDSFSSLLVYQSDGYASIFVLKASLWNFVSTIIKKMGKEDPLHEKPFHL